MDDVGYQQTEGLIYCYLLFHDKTEAFFTPYIVSYKEKKKKFHIPLFIRYIVYDLYDFNLIQHLLIL